ncbi:MAG: outer membrane protein assembly factor BamD [Calditrichia bacterium]
MKNKVLSVTVLFLILSIGLISCSPKVNKKEMDAQTYFEYAKKLFDKGKYLQAITEFNVVVLKFSGSPIVDDAQFYLAESHYKNDEYLIAVAEYQKLVDDYPESPYVEEAFYKMGLSYSELSQRPALDQEYTTKALRQLQNFVEAYPDGKFRPEAEKAIARLRAKLARKQLLGGDVYRKMGIYDSAIIYYDIILDTYYDTPVAENAMFWKAACQYKLNKYDEAISNFSAFLEKYPNSKYADRAKSNITEIQEKLSKLDVTQR